RFKLYVKRWIMANEIEYEAGAPKKADVLIRSTQHIALKLEELGEQLKLADARIEESLGRDELGEQIKASVARIEKSIGRDALGEQIKASVARVEEALEQFSKSNQDSAYVVRQSGEIFEKLQSENAVLKQELLYLAKQSENIYSGLAEKLNEISDLFKSREASLTGMADKVNDVASQAFNNSDMADRLAEVIERSKRNEDMFDAIGAKVAALSEKLDTVAERAAKSEKTINEKLSSANADDRETSSAELMNKLNYISEQLRRSEGNRTMLADKFEILSMRVEQFGLESAKSAPAAYPQQIAPVAYPAAVPAVVKQEIDYDLLASKVADILSVKETISPDYIASKVAEQIVLPELQASNINVSVDADRIARQVAELVDIKPVDVAPANVAVNIDEEALAERIASKMAQPAAVAAPANVAVNIDEEALAERIAEKLDVKETHSADSVSVSSLNLDVDELVDAIALKVGSLKSEDFEILVDDEGCTSISKEIANNLDYKFISDVVAGKLRDALDLVAANAPDYEDMAERISEKITVAGINEDAIADKAAAVLSNYLPELDVDEIADKVTGAVIDVVNAMPQPTVDNETICNAISERLIESQEDHDYDIVIDDEGISRITELVTEKIENQTGARFDKVEEELSKLTELLTPEVSEEEQKTEEEAVEAEAADTSEASEEIAVTEERDYTELCSLMAAEIEKGTSQRFDKVEEDIAKLADLVSGIVVEEEPEVEYEEFDGEPDYSKLSEAVASELEKVTARFDAVDENLAKINELLTEETEVTEESEAVEEDYAKLTETVATEVEKAVSAGMEEVRGELSRLSELVSSGVETEIIEENAEQDYGKLSEVVAAEIEKGVCARFDRVDESFAKLTEMISSDEQPQEVEEDYTELIGSISAEVTNIVNERITGVEESIAKLNEILTAESDEEQPEEQPDYAELSKEVATEVERTVAARLDGVEQNVAKLAELVANGVKIEDGDEPAGVDFTALSRIVAAEMLRGIDTRLEKVESDLGKITDYVEGEIPVETNSRIDKISEELGRLSTFMEGELSIETAARLEKLENDIAAISEAVKGGEVAEPVADSKVGDDIAEIKQMLASGACVNETTAAAADIGKLEEELAEIKEMLANGVRLNETAAAETVAAQAAVAEEEEEVEEPLVRVSEVIEAPAAEDAEEEEFAEEEEEDDADDDKDDDYLIDALDMDNFTDNELMPGEIPDFEGGVDFANMMKFKRSFIARIIQSCDEYKQYYGEVKHALLSYKKVNSNVAWSNERFNKGRETIARMKIRGKTLVIYLALDPNEYKTSVYHHIDVSDNKSVAGTPMMIKVKSNLGVRKAIRLIDEMLAKRNGEKKEIPERDYAAMYPYETIEELIEEGLVKDVRKK
ncbi:MAG TPA: hypothetical protein DD415_00750, partial [Clostridiales bacterium]|nr:hypothetical protein [Clostridiales bacterium]